jgi:hypothetical protein
LTSSTPAISLISVSETMGWDLGTSANALSMWRSLEQTYNNVLARLTEASSLSNSGFPVPKLTLQGVSYHICSSYIGRRHSQVVVHVTVEPDPRGHD